MIVQFNELSVRVSLVSTGKGRLLYIVLSSNTGTSKMIKQTLLPPLFVDTHLVTVRLHQVLLSQIFNQLVY